MTDEYDEAGKILRGDFAPSLEKPGAVDGWLTISDAPWDPDTLPPRPWLGPPYLMRDEMTLLHGPGAAGKSQLLIAWAIALALGKPFGRLQPKQRCRVVLTNFEDNEDEQRRRISAMLRTFDATPADLQGYLYRVSLGPNGDATMFKLDDNGQVATTPCWDQLKTACETLLPDAVFGDPLVAINAVPENDNQLMRRVMTIMRVGLAQHFHCAFVIAHHDNKAGGDGEDSDQTNARGGGDIVNAARFEIQTKKMTVAQAEQWGIDPADRGRYFRAGSPASKRNYTAPEEAEWFERLEAVVSNEAVVFCVPWHPPNGRLSNGQTETIVSIIEKGTPEGPYSPQIGNGDRSLAQALADIGITAIKAQREALASLLRLGHIEKADWQVRPGRWRSGLRSKVGLPYNYEWRDCTGA